MNVGPRKRGFQIMESNEITLLEEYTNKFDQERNFFKKIAEKPLNF